MAHPLIELGGSGPNLVVLPANGFPPETYLPALEPLLPDYRAVSLPPRALWEDVGPPPEEPGTWLTLAADLLEGMRRHALAPAIVVGHSFGAVAALLAAVRAPARFRALVLLDPTILPEAVLAEFAQQRLRGEAGARPLVQGALTRRNRFASEAAAFAYWRRRSLFADWSDDALLRYTRSMLRPVEDGLVLRWPPAWEAHYYESVYTDSWRELARLDPGLPLLVVRGTGSDTFVASAAERFAAEVPWAAQRAIPGRGHLFPQAAPGETGRILADWLGSLPQAPASSPPAV